MSLMNEGTRKWCRASNSLLWIARVEAYYESPPGGRGTQARSISVSSFMEDEKLAQPGDIAVKGFNGKGHFERGCGGESQ